MIGINRLVECYQLGNGNYFPILASIAVTLVKIKQKFGNISRRFIKKSQTFFSFASMAL